MDPQDLIKVWDAPDNGQLTPKQMSLRLPIKVAARISALCEMYPRKTKTEIIGDLLSTALDQFANSLPSEKGPSLGIEPTGHQKNMAEYFEDIGPQGKFFRLSGKFLQELEKECGIDELTPIPKTFIEVPVDPADEF